MYSISFSAKDRQATHNAEEGKKERGEYEQKAEAGSTIDFCPIENCINRIRLDPFGFRMILDQGSIFCF